ncbi:uncharacterized protein YALI1_A06104g [Yarrowia lipolytica]|uniref:Uncharacterized protein n=1 Tax=Yarrowia lipolytica TaxID=4952 RepID=A0A1D8N3V6_YARLL|nr:hypothetical protein YALI1_A06104g [Yarrowia lipolytica]
MSQNRHGFQIGTNELSRQCFTLRHKWWQDLLLFFIVIGVAVLQGIRACKSTVVPTRTMFGVLVEVHNERLMAWRRSKF